MVTNVVLEGLFDNGPITRLMRDVYIDFSRKDLPDKVSYPEGLTDYLDTIFYAFGKETYDFEPKRISLPEYTLDPHDPRCVCAFSGGKDSLANLILLKKYGYEPIPFFVKGINYQYASEYEVARELCKAINMELVEKKVSVRGKCEFPENPVKDQFIMAMMLDYGLPKGISNYSFGTYIDTPLEDVSKEYMLSDSSEMFTDFQTFVNKHYPEVDFPIFLNDGCEAYRIICDTNVDLVFKTQSCMSPARYRQNYIRQAEKKYGIKLPPNRCPSCYKCCTEAIYLHEFGVLNYPDSFIEHCKEVVKKFYRKYKSPEYMASMDSPDFQWTVRAYL